MSKNPIGVPARGVTLIELMVVVAVLAVTLSVASPLLQNLLHSSRLRADTGRFLEAINLARSEAVMRNVPVSVCPSRMAQTGVAECAGTYASGWIVFSNQDTDKVVDAPSDAVLQVFEGVREGYAIMNRSGTLAAYRLINYLPDGTSHSNRTLLFCPPHTAAVPSLSIVINIVGRARLVRDWGTCPIV